MKILFDQGTPAPLRHSLVGHSVVTAFEKAWDKLQNGDLIRVAEAEGFYAMITTDQNLKHQQNLRDRKLAILVLPTTSWQLPANGASLRFYAVNFQDLELTYAGNTIPLVRLGTMGNYSILGGNISACAGQSGELLFTQLGTSSGELMTLGNIQFSTQAVPEPSAIGLFALGGLLLGWRFARERQCSSKP